MLSLSRCCCNLRSVRRQVRTMNAQTYNVLQLGIGFFLVFFAFNSASFIEQIVISTSVRKGHVSAHAGYNSLAIIYAFFTFCNFLAAPVVLFLGARWSLVLGGITYAMFQGGFLFLNEPYLYISSAILGFGAAVIWTAQGKYLTMNSTELTAGKHSGIFWAISQACLSCGGIFLFCVFKSAGTEEEISDKSIHVIYGAFTSVTVAGICLLGLLRMPTNIDETTETSPSLPPAQEPQFSQLELLKSTLRLCITKRMMLLIVAFAYTGIELSFWSGIYPTCIGYTKKFDMNTKLVVALNAITQGMGQAAGGFLFGILSSKTSKMGRDRVVFLGTLINLIVFAGVYLNFPAAAPIELTEDVSFIQPLVPIALLCGFLLGFADACWNTQIFAYLISNYPNQSAQAFSLFKFWQSLLTCAAFFYGSKLYLGPQLLMLAVGSIVACIAFFLAEQLSGSTSATALTPNHAD